MPVSKKQLLQNPAIDRIANRRNAYKHGHYSKFDLVGSILNRFPAECSKMNPPISPHNSLYPTSRTTLPTTTCRHDVHFKL